MVWRRGKRWWFRLALPDGRSEQRSTGTKDKGEAAGIERMAEELRARTAFRPVLEALWSKQLSPRDVYADWLRDMSLSALLVRLADRDLEPYFELWTVQLAARFPHAEGEASTPARYLRYVRRLMPEGERFPRSHFTAERLTAWVASLEYSASTKVMHLAGVSSFANYLVDIGAIDASPVSRAKRPRQRDLTKRDRHLSMREMVRLIEACEDTDAVPLRTLCVLAHLGIETGVSRRLRRADVDLQERRIRVRGTKAEKRDRFVTIDAWAIPYLTRRCRGLLPDAPIAAGLRGEPVPRGSISRLWLRALERARITDYRLHDGRHTWAVRHIAAGVPAEYVAEQLGHTDTKQVNAVYGRFRPTAFDRDRYEKMAEARDEALAADATGMGEG